MVRPREWKAETPRSTPARWPLRSTQRHPVWKHELC